MSRPLLIVDGNSILHACHNGTTLTIGTMQVQAIFGFLRTLRALKSMPSMRGGDFVVLWDGRAQFRIDLYPEYKGNRKPRTTEQEIHHAAFKRQLPFIEAALKVMGVPQMRSPLLEADDLAGHVIRGAQGRRPVKVITGDRDWLAYVSDTCDWIDPIRDRSVTMKNFLEFTGYHTVDEFVHGKALQGDNSDNIDGIAGLGEKTAQLLLASWGNVHEFWAAVDAGTYTPAQRGKTAKSLHPEQILASPEGRSMVERNILLMDLRLARQPDKGEIQITRGAVDRAAFKAMCERLAFASILRELDDFMCDICPQHAALMAAAA